MLRPTSTTPISPYERAVCYYTLPKVIHPVTLGLIAIYALCVFEALAAMTYGLLIGDLTWTTVGAYSFAGIVGFGLVVFFLRALLNEVRERKALAEAHRAPMLTPAEDLPDPFADHVLLHHPAHSKGARIDCADAEGHAHYSIEHIARDRTWILRSPDDVEHVRMRVLRGVSSFSFSMDRPQLLGVFRDGVEVARVARLGGLLETRVEITSETLTPRHILIRNRGIYVGGALRGRLYTLRGQDYLDVHRDVLNDALLGYFATLS